MTEALVNDTLCSVFRARIAKRPYKSHLISIKPNTIYCHYHIHVTRANRAGARQVAALSIHFTYNFPAKCFPCAIQSPNSFHLRVLCRQIQRSSSLCSRHAHTPRIIFSVCAAAEFDNGYPPVVLTRMRSSEHVPHVTLRRSTNCRGTSELSPRPASFRLRFFRVSPPPPPRRSLLHFSHLFIAGSLLPAPYCFHLLPDGGLWRGWGGGVGGGGRCLGHSPASPRVITPAGVVSECGTFLL